MQKGWSIFLTEPTFLQYSIRGENQETRFQIRNHLWMDRLRHKKVFIVLDDVNNM